jgi:hypothetical protein
MPENKTPREIYNIPSPENTESREAEQTANEKLAKILADDFTGFATRFMNEEEYQSLLENQVLQEGEVTVFNQINFKNYLAAVQEDWGETMENQTMYSGPSGHSIRKYHELIELLKEAGAKVLEAGDQNKDIRNQTLDKFKELLTRPGKGYFQIEDYLKNENAYFDYFVEKLKKEHGEQFQIIMDKVNAIDDLDKKYVVDDLFDIKNELKKLEIYVSLNDISEFVKVRRQFTHSNEERKQVLTEFKNNPQFLSEKGNLRRLFNTLPYLFDDIAKFEGNTRGMSMRHEYALQYHILAVFNSEALDEKLKQSTYWGRLKEGTLQNTDLLAAVSIMPDKKLVDKMTRLSEDAGKFSHPVFNSMGNVAYPKQEIVP